MQTAVDTLQTSAHGARKGELTRREILSAAGRLFSHRGYEGTSIRDIESAAGVNRGVVTYHFGNKEAIWKASVDFIFSPYAEDLRSKRELIMALDGKTRRRMLISQFIRASAERPEMNYLMIQENLAHTWRIEWILEKYVRPLRKLHLDFCGDDPLLQAVETDANLRYILLGACVHAFALPREVESAFGRNVFDDAYVERHIETILNLIESHVPNGSA